MMSSSSLVGLWALEDDAILHHEAYFLQSGHVLKRIAWNGDDVGKFAGLAGIHDGGHGVVHALQCHSVRGNLVPLAMCLVHGGANLIECKGGNVIEQVIADKIAAVYVELDPVGAVRDLLANRFANFI